MRDRLRLLLGARKRKIVALGLCSIVNGFTEAAILVFVAQIAATAFKSGASFHNKVGILHIHASVGTLFAIAIALTVLRVLLQAPITMLGAGSPPKSRPVCARNCSAPSLAPPGTCSRASARAICRRR